MQIDQSVLVTSTENIRMEIENARGEAEVEVLEVRAVAALAVLLVWAVRAWAAVVWAVRETFHFR